jgi:CRISPR-associated protein (Cas_Csm6)
MKNALIVTLGTRDVAINREFLERNFTSEELLPLFFNNYFLGRPGGKFLLDNFDKVVEQIEMPILKSAFYFIGSKRIKIDKIILVATNQPENIEKRYRSGDSIHFSEIIKRLVPERFEKNCVLNLPIEIFEVSNNVVYLDVSFEMFSKQLEVDDWKDLVSFDNIFLLNQGGIDAINYGLMFSCLGFLGKKLRPLMVNESLSLCTELEFTGQFLHQQEKVKLASFLRQYDFAAIKELDISKDAKLMAEFAANRLNFDFDAANETLHQLGMKYRAERDFYFNELAGIQRNNWTLLCEVYVNAKIKLEQKAYVDFIQRFFRIVEELLIHFGKRALGENFQYKYETWENDIQKYLKNDGNADLLAAFAKPFENGSEFKYHEPNTEVFRRILETRDAAIFEKIKPAMALKNLRNKSIGAHDFKPVSEQNIKQILKSTGNWTLEKLLKSFDELLTPHQPFHKICQDIQRISNLES